MTSVVVEADALAVEDLGDLGPRIPLAVAGRERPGHQLSPLAQLAEDPLAPGPIEGLPVVGLAVAVAVELHRAVVDVVDLPALRRHEVVEEAAIVHEPALEHPLVGVARLVVGHLGAGEVEPEGARPDLDLPAGGVAEKVVVRNVVVLHRVDVGQDQAVGIEPAELADLVGVEAGSQPEVDPRGVFHALRKEMPRAPQVGRARETRLGRGQAAVLQVKRGRQARRPSG